jgi:hypothetical protein
MALSESGPNAVSASSMKIQKGAGKPSKPKAKATRPLMVKPKGYSK